MTGEMAGERDVLAEALHDEFWDSTMVHSASGFRACLDMENGSAGRVSARLAARGYTLSRSEMAGERDVLAEALERLEAWAGCVRRLMAVAPTGAVMDETGVTGGRSTPPERQVIRQTAIRIVDGWLARDRAVLAAAPSPEPLPLDVERPEYLDWLDTIEDAFGSDPNYQDGPQRHTRAHEAMRKLRAALREPDRPT